MSAPVWVDSDCGIDDALALLYLSSAGAQLAGVSTVHGNTTAAQAAANAAGVLSRAGVPTPVWVGRTPESARDAGARHGPDGLGGTRIGKPSLVAPGDGVEALLTAADGHRAMAVLVIGAATNLAAGLAFDADLPDRLGPVVLVAGSRPGVRDTNTWLDPGSTATVLDAYRHRQGLTVVTPAATWGAPLRERDLAAVRESRRWGGLAWAIAAPYSELQSAEAGERLLIAHDALAAAVLLHPEIATGVLVAGGRVVQDAAVRHGPGCIRWVHALAAGVGDHLARTICGTAADRR